MFDAAGEFAHVNDNGADRVFFLEKSWARVPQVREVTVPEGTPLLVPVVGISAVRDPRGISAQFGPKADFFDLIDTLSGDAHDLSIVIDGVAVAALEDGNLHYVNYPGRTDDEEYPLITDATGATKELGGYEITLTISPLTPGEHVTEMKGKGTGGLATDVTYLTTVE